MQGDCDLSQHPALFGTRRTRPPQTSIMGQIQWIYVDDYGRRHKVGLYHGDRSGHLMIHCNSRVIVIDFNVFSDKKYSFLINDDLWDVHVERKKNRFAYAFEIDKSADTPGNRRRRARNKRQLVMSLVVMAVLLCIIALTTFLMLGGIKYF